MELQLFTIRDSALEAYGAPMLYTSTGQAIREFNDHVNSKESQLHKHPEDYILYYLGTYNNETGHIDLKLPPKQIARAIDVIIRD